jgi:hypothetical protein
MTDGSLQLISLPLEVLGVLLAMLEVFSPKRAEAVTVKIVETAGDMRGFMSGILTIVTLGLVEAKPWQRFLVVGGLAFVVSFLTWRGSTNSTLLGITLWASVTLLIVVTYALVFLVFKLVRRFFPTRVLGIIGVLTASIGVLIESAQYGEALKEFRPSIDPGTVDFFGMALLFFYGAMFLCFASLLWTVISQGGGAAQETDT